MTKRLELIGHHVGHNHNRVRRLLREMGLEAIYPKPNLSFKGAGGGLLPDGAGCGASRGSPEIFNADQGVQTNGFETCQAVKKLSPRRGC